MCYDISFKVEIRQLNEYFPNLVHDDQMSLNLDAAIHIMGHAFGNHPIIFRDIKGDGKLHLRLMEWGCIPYYINDESAFIKQRASMLNARSERILEDTKSYWYKIRNRRCLIPVSGIYEHREIAGWKKKVPYLIALKDQPIFFLPGLYSVADIADKETGELQKRYTFTIITRPANNVMQQIHNSGDNLGRMPLFLSLEMSKQWVEEELSFEGYKTLLDFEMPSETLSYKTVYTIRTNKLRPDNKTKDEAYEWEKLPGLSLD